MTASSSPSLSEMLGRLEEIVRTLESDDTELDAALRLFEEGVQLIRRAQDQVQHAELRVQQVLENAAGELKLRDLDV